MEQKIVVDLNYLKTMNFSMQHNYVPLIQRIQIENIKDSPIYNLQLSISFTPEFAYKYLYKIDCIGGHEIYNLGPINIEYNPVLLMSYTEAMMGTIHIAVSEESELIYENIYSLQLLAYDQWSGLNTLPELIAAFVTPNHPRIQAVIKSGANYLTQWGYESSYTGYQSKNINLVKIQMAAIYNAILKENIIYTNPPASFAVEGQRIRLAHKVLTDKLGTCLDLSLLYSTCLEAIGLHPFVIFIEGHAFIGVWLEERTFVDSVVDDSSSLEKRIHIGFEELLLVETTGLTSLVSFDESLILAEKHLKNPEKFICLVDIKRSRNSGIRPIPIQVEVGREEDLKQDEIAKKRLEEVLEKSPTPLSLKKDISNEEVKISLTKQKIWERKLLDFTLRNTLLNFKDKKSSVELLIENLSELEDMLWEGESFTIVHSPREWRNKEQDKSLYELEQGQSWKKELLAKELKEKRIRTLLLEAELESSMKNLSRLQKLSIEENGANTLFVGLGFLRWYETLKAEKVRYAPLVLLPVDIIKSKKSNGYIIKSRQEEIQLNITLIEYLRQDQDVNIEGLDSLIFEEKGVDLPLIYQKIRNGISSKKRWGIEEKAYLGIFSFGQFVMWNDIKNRSKELEENKIVSSLMAGKLTYPIGDGWISEEEIDKDISLDKLAIPLAMDSSQLSAIWNGTNGKSFVLHGPPGTGKSQTITNIITTALYQGKTVLFVAEKMAALNVVKSRLENIGLDPFCLELHSNKSNKSSVLNQLDISLGVRAKENRLDYKGIKEKLSNLQQKLNGIIDALHQKREHNFSAYELIQKLEQYKDYKNRLNFSKEQIRGTNKEELDKKEEVIDYFISNIREIGIYNSHPLKEIQDCDYSLERREEFNQHIEDLLTEIEKGKKNSDSLYQYFSINGNKTKDELVRLVELLTVFLKDGVILEDLILSSNFSLIFSFAKEIVEYGLEYDEIVEELFQRFDESILGYDGEKGKAQWLKAEKLCIIGRFFRKRNLLKELRVYEKKRNKKDKSYVTTESIQEIYTELIRYKETHKEILRLGSLVGNKISPIFKDLDTSWNMLRDSLEKSNALKNILDNFDLDVREQLLSPLLKEIRVESEKSRKDKEEIIHFYNMFRSKLTSFKNTFLVNLSTIDKTPLFMENLESMLKKWRKHSSLLRTINSYNTSKECLIKSGLENMVFAYESRELDQENLKESFYFGIYYQLLLITISQDIKISRFQGNTYDQMILQYKNFMDEYQDNGKKEVYNRLARNIPTSQVDNFNLATSELSILKRAIKNNGRMLPLRKLFDSIPTLLPKLTPCMLMSPISVAQYVDPSFPKFDLVIFDEASQLPTSEAVGAIARGRNVIVVGDPKQLPPTNFFSSNHFDEENGELEDLESLLDDCLSISIPEKHLKWHYRSKHESLIAYSNMKYYDNKLFTFPSPSHDVSQVQVKYLDGYYDKGKTKHNRAEAKAIVDEIIRRLKDENLRRESIGVVTFNSVQQNLIEDLLEEEFLKYPKLEEYDKEKKEPIFIKNLENVQGDERDVILFSIGYGPDKEGKVSMNFGPLNREGGWRRLNVAISRARKSMIVFSVLRPEQIDLSRTRSEGVAGLKGFLEFAERGNGSVRKKASSGYDSSLVIQEIGRELALSGYEVTYNIGYSNFKIDMGIAHRDKGENYLLGILIDGDNTKVGATCSDRFLLWPKVLEGLGWQVKRIWILDYLDNKKKVVDSILKYLEALTTSSYIIDVEELNEKEGKNEEGASVKEDWDDIQNSSFEVDTDKIHVMSKAVNATHGDNCTYIKPYERYQVKTLGKLEDFYNRNTLKERLNLIKNVIEIEGPISKRILLKRVLASYGISRTTAKAESAIQGLLSLANLSQLLEQDRIFYWKKELDINNYLGYRVDTSEGEKRSIEDIPSKEIINAIIDVLDEHISIGQEELMKEVGKKFGFHRIGNIIETVILYAIEMGIESSALKRIESGNIIKYS